MTEKYDWLSDFVDYASIGEAPLHVLYWVGVATIAGALRRRVWLDQVHFQWVPNFYIAVVAPPGIISKSTTANIGFNLLGRVDGIHFGPDMTNWQSLVKELGEIGEGFEHEGGNYTMHAMTLAIDELGTFLDPTDREQVDAMVRLWDGKIGDRPLRKTTKTQGKDVLHNPWLNFFACTQPVWINTNFPETFLGGGLLSRFIFLFADRKRQRVPLLSEAIKARGVERYNSQRARLINRLSEFANLSGPFQMTQAAAEYAAKHYNEHWDKFENAGESASGYPARKQTHMFKLAMVISVARGDFPKLDVVHLEEAERQLSKVEPGIEKVLQAVGAKGITKAAQELVDLVAAAGGEVLRREVFGKHFFRRLSNKEFEEVIRSAEAAGRLRMDSGPKGAVLRLLKGPT